MALFRVDIQECQKFELMKMIIAHVPYELVDEFVPTGNPVDIVLYILFLYDDHMILRDRIEFTFIDSRTASVCWILKASNVNLSRVSPLSTNALCPTILNNLDTSFTSSLL